MFIGKWLKGLTGDIEPTQDRKIDYDLKKEDGDQSEDFEDWWGVEREGKKDESTSEENEDDDDDNGGEMMPIIDTV